jgi:hypothetical protein
VAGRKRHGVQGKVTQTVKQHVTKVMIRMDGSVKRYYYEMGPGCESPTIYGIRGGVKSGDTILGRGGDKGEEDLVRVSVSQVQP